MEEKVVIFGAGSWGTALATVLASKGSHVIIWDHNKSRAEEIQRSRCNERYLPGIKLKDNIDITSDLENILKDAKYAVFSIPSQGLREVIKKVSNQITDDMILINTAKGIEVSTGMRLSQVMKDEILGKFHKNIVVLSGPTHAEEVCIGLPTTIVAAGSHDKAQKVQQLFNHDTFRVYLNDDIIGVEIGGAVKNCLAIGAGIADGLEYGDNAKAALITRGIAEMIRYGKGCGAKESTFSGLSGLGDLIVTCSSRHSRNRHVGYCIGKGEKLDKILSDMTMVAEGVPTVKAIYKSSQSMEISMPITEAIYSIIYNGEDVKEAVHKLMNRTIKEEFY